MNPADIVSKTEKGRNEITERSNGLSGRLRQLLILVDGKKSVSTLIHSQLNSDECFNLLQELLSQGYITLNAGEEGIDAPNPSLGQGTDNANPASEPLRLEKAKRYLIDFVKGTVGDGTEKVIERIRGCTTRSELSPIIESCRKVVTNVAGQRKAEEFISTLNDILGENI